MLKISIIIPIYNKELYLKNCIESIINQTIFDKIELILINDGSTDNSEAICFEYSNIYPNIKYFNQINKGVSIARNNGLNHATGEFIYFMDADDTISKNFIELSYLNAITNNSDIVIVGVNETKHLTMLKLNQIFGFATWQGFYKKEFLKNANISFVPNLQNGEDIIFSAELLIQTANVSIEYNALYDYRKTINSLSTNTNNPDDYINIIVNMLNELVKIYKKNKKYNARNIILGAIAQNCFYPIFKYNKFSILQKIRIIKEIRKELLKNNLKYISYSPFNYHWRYSLLYFLFNLILV